MEGLAPAGHLGVQKGHHVSPSGNRTPVSRVTGGDTHHYTNEDDDSHKHTHSGPSTTPGKTHSVRLPQRPPLALHCTATQKTPKPGVNTRTPTRSPGRPPCRRTPVPAGLETRPLSHRCRVRVVAGNTRRVRTRGWCDTPGPPCLLWGQTGACRAGIRTGTWRYSGAQQRPVVGALLAK